jgi:hypothetical protein
MRPIHEATQWDTKKGCLSFALLRMALWVIFEEVNRARKEANHQ